MKKYQKILEKFLTWATFRHLEYGDLYQEWWVRYGQDLFIEWAEREHKIKIVKIEDFYKKSFIECVKKKGHSK